MAHTYKESGIDYEAMDKLKNAALNYSGNRQNLIEFPNFYLVDILEGLGSLNKLADTIYQKTQQDYYFQVGWGNAASVLNDLAVTGATPLTIKLFIAAGHANWFKNQDCWQNLIAGFGEAAKFASCSWNGGETQTLPGLIQEDSFILAGSATGIIKPKRQILEEKKIRPGDRIILCESSGIHTNGITFIRKNFPDDLEVYTEAVKNKTLIYLPFINKLLADKVDIHYVSHITGHGWRKLMRPKRPFTYVLEDIPKPQLIFQKIREKSAMDDRQMYADFNMGAGLAIYAPSSSVDRILKIAQSQSVAAFDAGFVEKGPRKVIIKPIHVEFDGADLNIR
ncbi:hypothetical protein HYW46_00565 [Candidatus Daviesbacteria bacterium]|nr:hypothetical protein [Candidatus Daviesbacteria bacterium]